MNKIDNYELNIRRQKLISQYQHLQADIMYNGNLDKSHIASADVIGQIAGRTVTKIDNNNSKEMRLYQSCLNSTCEDQLRGNYVNTIKKTEPHLSNIDYTNQNR